MREEFLVLRSAQGGPLALTSVSENSDSLSLRFEDGNPNGKYFVSAVKVNGRTMTERSLLPEEERGVRTFSVNFRRAPSYGEGFENMYEISLKVSAGPDESFAGAVSSGAGEPFTGAISSDAVDVSTGVIRSDLKETSTGTVNFLYDLSQKQVLCLSIDGRMLTQEQMEDWNKGSTASQTRTPLETLLGELDALPGLRDVKEEIRSSINMSRLQKIRRERGFSSIDLSLHMVFSGNPGTGKTTLARLLARIYKEAGILTRGQFVEADRSMLVSHYIGGTAMKTGRVVDSAIGGILFIDEAYSLADGQDGKDYGHEAIATLLKRMEDNRDNLIVIVAGYPEKMEKFLNSNPGFRSRFNRFIEFRDYSPEELKDIFLYECGKYGLVPEEGIDRILTAYFQKILLQKDPYFANGRAVRNLFEQTLVNQANRFEDRTDLTDRELMLILKEDLPSQVYTWNERKISIA